MNAPLPACLGIVLLLLVIGCGSPTPRVVTQSSTPSPTPQAKPGVAGVAVMPASPIRFEDRTAGSGLDFTYRNGEEADLYTILESLGGGVALLDYDHDGRLDIFVTGGGSFRPGTPSTTSTIEGRANRLFKNLGNWKFRDVTAECRLDQPVFYSHGVAVADINGDGWPDLFVTGYRRVALYLNESADPKDSNSSRRVFREITASSGIPADLPWSTSAVFGDLDGDGKPDLFVCQYLDWSFDKHRTCPHHNVEKDVCTPHAFAPMRPFVFRNLGNGRFEDRSPTCKLRSDGKGLGVVITDFNGDGKPDIYVANDASENHLYLNAGDWKLDECGGSKGVAVDETGHVNGSMGIAVADWDRTGKPSMLVTNFQNEWHAFYQNMGRGQFAYRTHPSGMARLGQHDVGFGTAFADFDHDGWDDLVITTGHVLRHPAGSTLEQLPVLMQSVSDGGRRMLKRLTGDTGTYFQQHHRGRGLALGDLDNDGYPDLVISHQNQPVVLLKNVSSQVGTATNWLGVELRSPDHRCLVGTHVTIQVQGTRRSQYITSGGYLSQNEPRMLFGLGEASVCEEIQVEWPWGGKLTLPGPLDVNRYLTVSPAR